MKQLSKELKTAGEKVTEQNPKIKAQGMVEFALTLPILLLLILGIIEFGRLLFIYSAVTSSSREAARYGAATEYVSGSVNRYEDCAGIRAAAKRVGILTGIQDDDIAIHYDNGSVVVESDCQPNVSVKRGDRIVVSVTANYTPVVPLVNIPPIPITSTTARTLIKAVTISGLPPDDSDPPPSPPPPPPPPPLGCPTAPLGLEKQAAKKLRLELVNSTPENQVVISNIIVDWDFDSGGYLNSIAFLSLSWNGSSLPTFTYPTVPAWSGTFDQQDMIFTFSDNLSGIYEVTVTFEGDDCEAVYKTYLE
jgi:Flp pilus assembly protein TadG